MGLGEEVKKKQQKKKQLGSKGRDPHFGHSEDVNIHEEFSKVSGSLTCLWAEMMSPKEETDKGKNALLVQKALVLFESDSYCSYVKFCGAELIQASSY